eukprot:5410076-Amphidinium_carterae.1
MDRLQAELDGDGEPANETQNAGDDASMHDASEEPQRDDHAPGGADAADGDAEDRKRIRNALEQGIDPLGLSGSSLGPSTAVVLEHFLKPKAKAKGQPSSQE